MKCYSRDKLIHLSYVYYIRIGIGDVKERGGLITLFPWKGDIIREGGLKEDLWYARFFKPTNQSLVEVTSLTDLGRFRFTLFRVSNKNKWNKLAGNHLFWLSLYCDIYKNDWNKYSDLYNFKWLKNCSIEEVFNKTFEYSYSGINQAHS